MLTGSRMYFKVMSVGCYTVELLPTMALTHLSNAVSHHSPPTPPKRRPRICAFASQYFHHPRNIPEQFYWLQHPHTCFLFMKFSPNLSGSDPSSKFPLLTQKTWMHNPVLSLAAHSSVFSSLWLPQRQKPICFLFACCLTYSRYRTNKCPVEQRDTYWRKS